MNVVVDKLSSKPQLLETVQNCLAHLPKRGNKLLNKAQQLYINQDYAACLTMLSTCLEKALNTPETLSLNGLCQDKLGEHDEAIESFKAALQLDIENIDCLYNIARLYAQQNQPEIALAYIEFAESTLVKSEAEAHRDDTLSYLKATVLEDLQQPEESIVILEELIRDNPQASYLRYLGELYMLNTNYDKAIETLEQLLLAHPDDIETLSILSKTLGKLARWDETITHCRHILDLYPGYPEACNQIGLAMYAQENYEEAITYYEQALAEDPDFALVLNNLGYCYLKKDRYDKAQDSFTHYKTLLSPDSPELEEVEKQLQFIEAKMSAEAP